ncbi:MAG: acyloxyacyl hydrolase [Gammaproteobacteria bacterium]|nr:acyloxyacyl hydrolase [Gammaproteobacteria bacterium]
MAVSIRMRRAHHLLLGGVLLGVGTGTPVARADSVAVTAGHGFSHSPNQLYLSYQRDWERRWLEHAGWHLSGAWDFGMGLLHTGAHAGLLAESSMQLGAAPVLRMQRDSRDGLYFEAGVGLHLLSNSRIGDLDLGTNYQFASRVGLGLRFGSESTFDLSYHVQHMSNGSLKKPNDGAEFHLIRAQYHF